MDHGKNKSASISLWGGLGANAAEQSDLFCHTVCSSCHVVSRVVISTHIQMQRTCTVDLIYFFSTYFAHIVMW